MANDMAGVVARLTAYLKHTRGLTARATAGNPPTFHYAITDRELDLVDALLAAYADAARDRERMDWLDSEEQRADRVLAISVKRNHDRSCGDWTNAAGPVRDTIDAARTGEAR